MKNVLMIKQFYFIKNMVKKFNEYNIINIIQKKTKPGILIIL